MPQAPQTHLSICFLPLRKLETWFIVPLFLPARVPLGRFSRETLRGQKFCKKHPQVFRHGSLAARAEYLHSPAMEQLSPTVSRRARSRSRLQERAVAFHIFQARPPGHLQRYSRITECFMAAPQALQFQPRPGAAGVPLKGSGSSAAPTFQSDNTCASTSTSDQITAAGAFATTCSVPATNLAVGAVIEVYIHGVWTTTATSSPKLNFEVNAGGTTGLCPAATTAVALTASQTNGVFDGTCRIVIVTTGSSGTAIAGGFIQVENGAGAGGIPSQGFNSASTVVYNTTISETVSVQETTAMVSGQTMNLQSLIVRVTP
jgi:hypothetical protein